MAQADSAFDQLLGRLTHSDRLVGSGGDPIYYLVFPPDEMIYVKQRINVWTARLRKDGWEPQTLSVARVVNDSLAAYRLRPSWLKAEKEDPFDFATINTSLGSILIQEDVVTRRILAEIEALRSKKKPMLLVTDLEALHPYLRIGAVEQKLQGKAEAPVVFLYPGVRAGKATLRFLGIYPEDGNYRSIHVGG